MSVARAVVVEHLPGNRAAAAVQSAGEVVFALAQDRPLDEIAGQLTDLMQAEIDSGTWAQCWAGPGEPSQLQSSVNPR